jgi:Down syndrome cell adhesion molecule
MLNFWLQNRHGFTKNIIKKTYFLEPPNFPRNLHAKEIGSRSILLGWSNSYNVKDLADTQPVHKFILQFKDSSEPWHKKNNEQIIPGDQSNILLESLKPASNYHFRIFAENHLGTSAPSDILHVRTNDEAPSGAPNVIIKPIGGKFCTKY